MAAQEAATLRFILNKKRKKHGHLQEAMSPNTHGLQPSRGEKQMAPISSNTSKAQVNAGKQTKPRGPGPLRRLLPFIKPYAALYLVGIVGVALANLGFNVVFARMIIDFTRGAMEISPRAILVR